MMEKKELIKLLKTNVKEFNCVRPERFIDLSNSDLSNSDLSGSDLRGSNLRGSNLRGSNLRGSNLRNSDLRNSDLRNSDLRNSDLRGSDLDFSVFPLWCGSFDIIINLSLVYQLCYHICRLKIVNKNGKPSKTGKAIQNMLKPFANKFHRVKECGKIRK